MVQIFLRYDLREVGFGRPRDEMYQACLEQVSWADREGFTGVRLHEHHGTDDGYLPSPILMAAAIAARTRNLALRFSVLVFPLHEPVRIAEDIAVLDILSRGRVQLVLGAGYLPDEFEMFGRDRRKRGRLMEEGVAILRQAWTGEAFLIDGRRVRVRPRPYQDRAVPIILGGSSVAAAQRAARIADGYEPAAAVYLDDYLTACRDLGRGPGWVPGPTHGLRLLHVAQDVDGVWEQVVPFALYENNSYSKWMLSNGGPRIGYDEVPDGAALRAAGKYCVVTPGECVDLIRKLGPEAEIHLHPLMGGMTPELGWASLRLFRDEVMPRLRSEGLL